MVARERSARVSVVIPTYNRAAVVGDAIASALEQTHRDVEVLVVDDGSTDDTAKRFSRLDDRRVRYLAREHAGVSAARNAGIAAATGEIVAFLDSDDLWKPAKLETELAALARHPTAAGVFSDLEKRDGATFVPSFIRETRVFARLLAERGYPESVLLSSRALYFCLLQEVPIKMPVVTLRRAALDRVGGFDEQWTSGEDWQFLLRLAREHALLYLDQPLAIIRVLPDSLHRRDQERGDRAMLHCLARERRHARDPETRRAATAGVVERAKHLSWYYRDSGRRLAAMGVCLEGFRLAWDATLLLRALASWGPENPRRYLSRRFAAAIASVEKLVEKGTTEYVEREHAEIRQFLEGHKAGIFDYIMKNAEVSETFIRGGLLGAADFSGTLERVNQVRPIEITHAPRGDVSDSGWKLPNGRIPVTFRVTLACEITVTIMPFMWGGTKFRVDAPVDLPKRTIADFIPESSDITVERELTVEASAARTSGGALTDLKINRLVTY